MKALFWTLWILDLLLSLLAIGGKAFRSSFTGSDTNTWLSVLLFSSLIGGILLHLVFKKAVWALFFAAAPLLTLLIWYIIEKLADKV